MYAVRQQTHNMFINRNHMLKGVYGQYTFCVNVDADTGAPIAPDNGVGGGCTN